MQEQNSKSEQLSFVNLALALASDYNRLFVVDAKDRSYVVFTINGDDKELVQTAGGDDFFLDIPREAKKQIWEEDQELFLEAFTEEKVMDALDHGQAYTLTYRQNVDGAPRYLFVKAVRTPDGTIVMGIRDIDDQKKKELESEKENLTYAEIAQSLASLFEIIYHIEIDTGHYSLYSATESFAKLNLGRENEDFFESAKKDMRRVVHPDDQERILKELDKEVLLRHLHESNSVSLTYRQMMDGEAQYVNLLAFIQNRGKQQEHLIIGVRNVDAQMRLEQAIRAESQTFNDMAMALARRYEVIYRVNIVTNEYVEYNASEQYAKLKVGTKGKDFFGETQQNMKRDIYPDDLPMMSVSMQKENLLNSLDSFGKTFLNYRLMLDGRAQYVSLYAVRPQDDSDHIIVAVANVDAAKRMEIAYQNAVDMANRDALTGVKNKRAYVQAESDLDDQISHNCQPDFAIVVCDVNGLKRVNDTKGHNEGDDFIRKACGIICETFKHSPVFRVGGDEFVVIMRGQDYSNREKLMEKLRQVLSEQLHEGMVMLASGISEFLPDSDLRVQDVFERADAQMYRDKAECKTGDRE